MAGGIQWDLQEAVITAECTSMATPITPRAPASRDSPPMLGSLAWGTRSGRRTGIYSENPLHCLAGVPDSPLLHLDFLASYACWYDVLRSASTAFAWVSKCSVCEDSLLMARAAHR